MKSFITEETEKLIKSGMLQTKNIRIFETDTIIEVAVKIWISFQVGQSCTIRGVESCYCVQNPVISKDIPRGEFVVEELMKIIKNEFQRTNVNDVKRARGKNTELGYKESKLFRYHQDVDTGNVTVWRMR